MAVTYGDVKRWRAAPLGTAATGLKADLTALERSTDLLESGGYPKGWSGLTSVVAHARHALLLARMRQHVSGVRGMYRALADTEQQVTRIESAVEAVEGQATAQEFAIGADGSVRDTSKPGEFDSVFELLQHVAERARLQAAIAEEVTEILGQAAYADATLANAIPAGTVTSIDERGVASPATAQAWTEMSDEERRRAIQEMVKEMAEEAGIDPVPDITFSDLGPDGANGFASGGSITINTRRLNDPDVLHTVAHEMRHERQSQAIDDANPGPLDQFLINAGLKEDPFKRQEDDGITRQDAADWKKNQEHYISADDDFEGYYNQPVEADARDTGREYLDGLTPEELRRLEREGR